MRERPFAGLGAVARLARRDLAGSLRGLRIFLATVALGVGAIVAIGALSQSIAETLAAQGRVLLGGDFALSRGQRPLSAPERAALERYGRVSEIASTRAMARAAPAQGGAKGEGGGSGVAGEPALVEIKAVDAAWPLYGDLRAAPALPLSGALDRKDGLFGALVDPALLDRLGLKVGDGLKLGAADLRIAGEILSEPDRLSLGVGFGPRVLISAAAFAASGLDDPTALTRWSARVALPAGAGGAQAQTQAAAAGKALLAQFPQAGWEWRSAGDVSPQLSRNLDRLTQFMSLIGLTSLIVGGVGIAGAVQAFVARKRTELAILKSLGASGFGVFAFVFLEMAAVAVAGAALGGALGLAAPFAVAPFVDPAQFPFEPVLAWRALAQGLGLGLLACLAFVVAPAGRAHDGAPTALFRPAPAQGEGRLRLAYRLAALAAFGALALAVYAGAADRRLALIVMACVGGAALALRGLGLLVVAAAARAPASRGFALRLARANIARPGAATGAVVAAFGLGLTLIVAIAAVENNVQSQLARGEAGRTPDFFFVDVRASQADEFGRFLRERRPDGHIETAPMLRGRIVRVADRSAQEAREALGPDNPAVWTLEGDRGVTYAATPPAGSQVVAGDWWGPDYKGPPLVSLDAQIAAGLGVGLGDSLTVNVAGRLISGRIANLRQVDWRSFGINFVLVFSPNAFAGAPHSVLFTLSSPEGARRDGALVRAVADSFPGVSVVGVREALDQAMVLVDRIARAMRLMSMVALATAALVIGAAIAASARARLYDAAVLRALGASRARIAGLSALEFALLGLAAAAFAFVAGSLAAQAVVTRLMRLEFAFDPWLALGACAGGMAAAAAFGLVAGFFALRAGPARLLRDL